MDYNEVKIGDKVKIVKEIPSQTDGWDNAWVTQMGEYVGNDIVYTVKAKFPAGIELEEDPGNWHWPWQSLQLVSMEITRSGYDSGPVEMEEPERELTPEEKLIEYRKELRKMLGG